uniref:Uncharacterized LOC105935253 n=1 Tax=Fundulus heteroclitus TaxID=8078 RepID=A0A3Q2P1V7_FUNHE
MAACIWRMNGLGRRMTGVLLLCALLSSNEVMSQTSSDAPATGAAVADSTAAADLTLAEQSNPESQTDEPSANSTPPADAEVPVVNTKSESLNEGIVQTTHAPGVDVSTSIYVAKIGVECVGEGDIHEPSAVEVRLTEAKDCGAILDIFEETKSHWCHSETCDLKILTKDNLVLVSSSNTEQAALVRALQAEHMKSKLSSTEVVVPSSSSSSGSSVFVGILVTGLIAAVGIIVGYCKCQRRPDTKGAKLAEETYPVDPENQGNTLASEAPLNPPPETQEKPSINGESLEAVKTETSPPTNGHSTAKTADTEL